MRKKESHEDSSCRKTKSNRRKVLRQTGTIGLAAMTIPSSAIAQGTESSQTVAHEHDFENQKSGSDYVTQILETETYTITKATRGDGVTYLKEFTDGEKEGEIHVSTFEEEVIPENEPVEEPLIPETSEESAIDSTGSLSLHSDGDCSSGGWKDRIGRVDTINERIGEDCNGRIIDDDAYGEHRYSARSVHLRASLAAICTAELTNIITYLLEPLGIPQTDRAVSYAVGSMAAWSTRKATIGAIDYDGKRTNIPYITIQGAREFSADHDELTSFGSVPGHLEVEIDL